MRKSKRLSSGKRRSKRLRSEKKRELRKKRAREKETNRRRLRRFFRDQRAMGFVLGGIAHDFAAEVDAEEARLMFAEGVAHPFDLSRKAKATIRKLRKEEKELWRLYWRARDCGEKINVCGCTSCGFVEGFQAARECGIKVCPFAQQKKSAEHFKRVRELVAMMKNPRFMTLTLKHRAGDSLEDLLSKLLKSFKTLRRRRLFKDLVLGGVAALEITWGAESWHPHIHVIYDGSFFPQEELSALWLEITGDSSIVDVRKVDQNAVSEMSKYLAKPASFLYQHEMINGKSEVKRGSNGEPIRRPFEVQKRLVKEFMEATRGLRTLRPFGALYGAKPEVDEESVDVHACPACGALNSMEIEVISRADAMTRCEDQEDLEKLVRAPPRARVA